MYLRPCNSPCGSASNVLLMREVQRLPATKCWGAGSCSHRVAALRGRSLLNTSTPRGCIGSVACITQRARITDPFHALTFSYQHCRCVLRRLLWLVACPLCDWPPRSMQSRDTVDLVPTCYRCKVAVKMGQREFPTLQEWSRTYNTAVNCHNVRVL